MSHEPKDCPQVLHGHGGLCPDCLELIRNTQTEQSRDWKPPALTAEEREALDSTTPIPRITYPPGEEGDKKRKKAEEVWKHLRGQVD